MSRLGDRLARYARQKPLHTAIADEQGRTLHWRALHDTVMRQAHRLRLELSASRRPVALSADQGLSWCVADLALLEAGIPCLPLPAFFTPDQTAHALRHSGAQAILHAKGNYGFEIQMLPPSDPVDLPPGTAKISYTSGSTGTPKGICLGRNHLLEVAQAVVDTVGPAHVGSHLSILPPGILLENVAGLYATLLARRNLPRMVTAGPWDLRCRLHRTWMRWSLPSTAPAQRH